MINYFKLRRNQDLSLAQNTDVLFHCASFGEVQSILLLAQKLKENHSNPKLTISFTSSSGHENIDIANSPFDSKLYGPIDRPKYVNDWLDQLNPKLAIIAQNEIWPTFLKVLCRRGIPFLYVDSYFQDNWKNRLWVRWNSQFLNQSTGIYSPSQNTIEFLKKNLRCPIQKTTSLRNEYIILSLSQNKVKLTNLKTFKGEYKLLVLGSLEPSDLKVITSELPSISKEWKILIAPHDINQDNIKHILKYISDEETSLFSNGLDQNHRYGILDQFGLLKATYQYADLVYIGGGFGKGVHNVIEPAYWGKQVISGPNTKNISDISIIKNQFEIIKNKDQFIKIINSHKESETTPFSIKNQNPSRQVFQKIQTLLKLKL